MGGLKGRSMMGQPEGTTTLRLVMITGDGPEHHYVINRILEEYDLEAIIVDTGRRQTRVDRARSLLRKYTAPQLWSRLMLRLTAVALGDAARRRHELLAVLGPGGESFTRPDLVRYVEGINTEKGRAAVSDTSPDVLLIYGTGIVGDRVLGMATQAAINLHTGMSPHYRGADCAFWPIYNGESHLIGATIHECTPRVDGGTIYEQAPADLHPGEGQFAIFARCVEVGAELYVATIHRARKGSLNGEEQDVDIGREYRAADKRLGHDLAVRWRLRSRRAPRSLRSMATPRGTE